MNTKRHIPTFFLAAAMVFGTGFAWSQPSGQSGSDATTSTGHNSNMDRAGRATKNGAKKGWSKTKHGTKKGWKKTKNTTKGAYNGAKQGAQQPQ
jgi:hypothetical protein